MHDSQSAFLQRFQKVLLVLLLFDIVICLVQVTVRFFFNDKCSGFWISSTCALHDSQSAFLQRFQKVLLVLLLFDIVICLVQVTVRFF